MVWTVAVLSLINIVSWDYVKPTKEGMSLERRDLRLSVSSAPESLEQTVLLNEMCLSKSEL